MTTFFKTFQDDPQFDALFIAQQDAYVAFIAPGVAELEYSDLAQYKRLEGVMMETHDAMLTYLDARLAAAALHTPMRSLDADIHRRILDHLPFTDRDGLTLSAPHDADAVELTAWAVRNETDLILLSGRGRGGAVVYAPPTEGEQGVLVRIRREQPTADTQEAPQAQDTQEAA